MPAQETLLMYLTSGGVTSSVGNAQDTLQSWIQTKAWDLDQADRAKFIDQIIVHVSRRSQQVNFDLEIYGSDDEDGPFSILQTLDISAGSPLNPDVAAFKYFKFRFIDRGVRERWRLHGFEVSGEVLGDEF